MEDGPETCVVFLLGYPGVGKRTVGSHLAELLDGVLVDNALIHFPLLTLFKWDGKFPITMEIWERVGLIREAVLGTIEDLAPKSNSYVFTNVLKDDEDGGAPVRPHPFACPASRLVVLVGDARLRGRRAGPAY